MLTLKYFCVSYFYYFTGMMVIRKGNNNNITFFFLFEGISGEMPLSKSNHYTHILKVRLDSRSVKHGIDFYILLS